jgi:light-regulated signal transduction histidine kinase (bacteriophytochrome)
LQDFTSVASHDLQEPLRKVQNFGDRLKTEYRGALDEQGQDYLDRMLNATKRMQSLIHDLLVFSRVGSKARSFLPVDLAQVTREVLSDLEVRIAETNALVEVGDLPTIDADAMQMRQLLQNLIGNALKFHQKGKPAAVRVYAETGDFRPAEDGIGPAAQEMFRLVVEDNGIGFDEKYLDRIFTVFQRLHSRAEYEGTGVGLAVCRKIAERHGGRITATSTVGQGASFLVALPRYQANENSARIPGGRADMHLGIPGAANSLLASMDGETS